MSVNQKIEQIFPLAQEVVSSLGFNLVDVRLAQEGRERSLEITIFSPDKPVGLQDCEQVSRAMGNMLDEQEPPILNGSFLFTVQSPGTDRLLKNEREMQIFIGQNVSIQAKSKVEGVGANFEGRLLKVDTGRITLGQLQVIKSSPKASKKAPTVGPMPEKLELDLAELSSIRLKADALGQK
jgi:ribosome maturation factor RimP